MNGDKKISSLIRSLRIKRNKILTKTSTIPQIWVICQLKSQQFYQQQQQQILILLNIILKYECRLTLRYHIVL